VPGGGPRPAETGAGRVRTTSGTAVADSTAGGRVEQRGGKWSAIGGNFFEFELKFVFARPPCKRPLPTAPAVETRRQTASGVCAPRSGAPAAPTAFPRSRPPCVCGVSCLPLKHKRSHRPSKRRTKPGVSRINFVQIGQKSYASHRKPGLCRNFGPVRLRSVDELQQIIKVLYQHLTSLGWSHPRWLYMEPPGGDLLATRMERSTMAHDVCQPAPGA
jgi:hypothetical protein